MNIIGIQQNSLENQDREQDLNSKISFNPNDPLALFLSNKLRFTPIRFAFTLSIIVTAIYSIAALASDTLIKTGDPNHCGLLKDWFSWV